MNDFNKKMINKYLEENHDETAKALYEFNSILDYQEFYKKTLTFEWTIQEGTISQRARKIRTFKFKSHLKEQYKNIFDHYITDKHIISYTDTMTLMYRLLTEYLSDLNLRIYMEYKIPYANNKRIDFLVSFKNTILLLEFSYIYENDEDENKEIEIYNSKLTQVMQYKTLLSNIIDKSISIIPIVVVYAPETNSDSLPIDNFTNLSKLHKLSEFIKLRYSTDTNADQELLRLKSIT